MGGKPSRYHRRMAQFHSLLILLVCAVLLASLARYLKLPYPSLLALGGGRLEVVVR